MSKTYGMSSRGQASQARSLVKQDSVRRLATDYDRRAVPRGNANPDRHIGTRGNGRGSR